MGILDKNRKGLTKEQRVAKKHIEEETERRVNEFKERLPKFREEYHALTRKHKIDFFISYDFHPSRGMFGMIVPADISIQVEDEEKARIDQALVKEQGNGIVKEE